MEHHLAENIRKYRKERGMTQEALAEKLNLTIGTISKWERGSSEPELSYLMQLAQIFHVSLDALLGFSIRSSNIDVLVEKIEKLINAHEFDEAKKECEAALLIYPNNFKVVYAVGFAYNLTGIITNDEDALRNAIRHLKHSLDLISQNTDPQISSIEIQNTIANCYLSLKETRKGIDELKKNNVCGINDADIAVSLIGTLKQDQEGMQYARKAFGQHGVKLISVLFSIMAYYINEKKPVEGIQAANWLIGYLRSLKIDPAKNAFVDKYIAFSLLFIAIYRDIEGDRKLAQKEIQNAVHHAEVFDEEPCFDTRNIIYIEAMEGNGYVYDCMGITSRSGLLKVIDDFHLEGSVTEWFIDQLHKEIESSIRKDQRTCKTN